MALLAMAAIVWIASIVAIVKSKNPLIRNLRMGYRKSLIFLLLAKLHFLVLLNGKASKLIE